MKRPFARRGSQLPCVCLCACARKLLCVRLCTAVYPGAVSLQCSLIHSISLFVGARVCGRGRQEREGWRVITGTSCCSLIGHLLCHGAGPQPSYISWEGWRGPDTHTHTPPLSATQSWQSDWRLEDPVQSVSGKFTSKMLGREILTKWRKRCQYWLQNLILAVHGKRSSFY